MSWQKLSVCSAQVHATVLHRSLNGLKIQLDLQSAGSSPNLTYTKLSARDAIMIP